MSACILIPKQESYFAVSVSVKRPCWKLTVSFGLGSLLGRAKLGLAACLQLSPSTVWLGLYPVPGERLEQWCSCASNCAHLHSPHHPPRRRENTRFQRMDGAWGLGDGCGQTERPREEIRRVRRAGPQGRVKLTGCVAAPRVFFSFKRCSLAKRMLLLPSSCSSLCSAAIKQNALFMKTLPQTHTPYLCAVFA